MKLRETFYQFAEETPFQCLAFILTCRKPLQIFWFCAFTAAVGLFIRDFIALISYYQLEPTVVLITFEKNGGKAIKTPTLCAEFVFNQNFTGLTGEYSETVDFLMATNNTNKLDFTDWSAMNLSSSTELISYILLGHLTDVELFLVNQYRETLTELATKGSSTARLNSIFLTNFSVLYQTYLQNNVSLANLKRLIGSAICQKLFSTFETFKYAGDPEIQKLPLCEPEMITHLSFSLVCSKLFKTEAVKLVDPRYIYFSISDTRQQAEHGQYALMEFVTSTSFTWHLDFEGRAVLPKNDRTNIFSWDPGNAVRFDVWLKEEFEFYSTKQSPCTFTDETDSDYEWRIGAELMFEFCGCWPATLFHLKNSRNHRLCDHHAASVTVLGVEGNYTSQMCNTSLQRQIINSPPKNCLIFSYHFRDATPYFTTWAEAYAQSKGRLEFGVHYNTDRIINEQKLSVSWENLLWQFGGTIGSWLGAFLYC